MNKTMIKTAFDHGNNWYLWLLMASIALFQMGCSGSDLNERSGLAAGGNEKGADQSDVTENPLGVQASGHSSSEAKQSESEALRPEAVAASKATPSDQMVDEPIAVGGAFLACQVSSTVAVPADGVGVGCRLGDEKMAEFAGDVGQLEVKVTTKDQQVRILKVAKADKIIDGDADINIVDLKKEDLDGATITISAPNQGLVIESVVGSAAKVLSESSSGKVLRFKNIRDGLMAVQKKIQDALHSSQKTLSSIDVRISELQTLKAKYFVFANEDGELSAEISASVAEIEENITEYTVQRGSLEIDIERAESALVELDRRLALADSAYEEVLSGF